MVPHLAVTKVYGDSFRVGATGVSWSIRECEWDKVSMAVENCTLLAFENCTLSATGWPLGERRSDCAEDASAAR